VNCARKHTRHSATSNGWLSDWATPASETATLVYPLRGSVADSACGNRQACEQAGGDNDEMISLKLILFDIDGTLIDTGGAGSRSWTWAFEHAFNRPVVDIGKYSSAGMTDPVVARKTFTEAIGREPTGEELARLISAYLSVLPDYVTASEGYRVLPGVTELLPRLHDTGVLLGVTTGAMEAGAHAKLGRARLNHFFLVGGYGSDSADRVELTTTAVKRGERLLGRSLDPREVAVVGDTPLDISAAQDAGVVSVGVATGKYELDELRAADPDYALGSLEEPFPSVEY
jgi:phosphoglycolate phosphatase